MIEGQPLRVGFPDGRALDAQPALLVTVFTIIEDEWQKEVAEQFKRGN